MRIFQCPAAYAPHIVEAIARALEEGSTDRALRGDDDERVRRLAGVPDTLIDPSAVGHVVILVGIVDDSNVVNDFLVSSVRGITRADEQRRGARDLRLVAEGGG